MKKIKKIGMTIIAPILAAGITLSPTASAFMMTDFAPADDQSSRSIVQTGSLNCTGVLIAPQYVLTASHCVASQPYGEIDRMPSSVYIGPDVENREKVSVESAITHPIYDVALLKLKEEAKTIPAKLYTGNEALDLRSEMSSYGWGTLSAAKQSSELIDKEDLDSLHKNIAANKVRKAEGTVVNGRINVDENGQPIKNDKGQIVISRYTSAKGFNKMKGENAGVNIKFTDPSKSVYGDSGAPIFSGDTVYGILSGGLLHTEALSEGSTIVASPVYKFLPWIQEKTGIDFTDEAYNKEIDEKIASSNITFKDAKVSPEDIEREKNLIKGYKESLEESNQYVGGNTNNNSENGDIEVEAPIEQDENDEIQQVENGNTSSSQVENDDPQPSSDERYTITDSDGKIIDYGYGNVSEFNSDEENKSDSNLTTPVKDSSSHSTEKAKDHDSEEKNNYENKSEDTQERRSENELSNNESQQDHQNLEEQLDNNDHTNFAPASLGPKVDTGGKISPSIISKIINIFH